MAPAQSADQTADPAGAVTARPLLLIGGGEHAGVVAEAAATDRGRWRIVGYTDPRPDLGPLASTRAPRLGDDSAGLARFDAEPSDDHPTLVLAVGGVGDPGGRRRVSHTVEGLAAWARWATIVHATAWVSPSAELSDGTVVLAGVIVNAGASVGRHGIVNTRAVVEHDVRIGDFVHIGPGAIIGGGAGIGSDVTIGMGAVVVADVPPGVTVVGSPARPLAAPATSDVRA